MHWITLYRHFTAFIIMMTSSNGDIFRVTGPLCGEFTDTGEFPAQMPVTRSFDVFFDLRPNKRLNKHPWVWWFETPLWSLWCQCNVLSVPNINSSDAGDGIFRVWRSISCLLMHWLQKSPVHQQACYWLCGTDNMYFCSKVSFIYWGQTKSKIWFKIWICIWLSLKQFSMPLKLFNIRFFNNSTLSFCDNAPKWIPWTSPVLNPQWFT